MQRSSEGRQGYLIRPLAVVAITLLLGVTLSGTAAAKSSASDSRAVFVNGNATTCAGVGEGSATQLGGTEGSANDANVAGTVKTNAGSIQPGTGTELNVRILGENVTVMKVIVKAGTGYNDYGDEQYLPPTLPPDQHYIGPLDGEGDVPIISHWFVCYTQATEVPPGNVGAFAMTGLAAAGFVVASWWSRKGRRSRP